LVADVELVRIRKDLLEQMVVGFLVHVEVVHHWQTGKAILPPVEEMIQIRV